MEVLRSIPLDVLKKEIESSPSWTSLFKDQLRLRMNSQKIGFLKELAAQHGWQLPRWRRRTKPKQHMIHLLTKEQLEELVNQAPSFIWCIRQLGLPDNVRYYREELKKMMELYGLQVPICKDFRGLRVPKYALDEILIEDSPYCSSGELKKKLIKEGVLVDKCSICGLGPVWQGKPLTLQLDHVNGKHSDNRLENLRVLCGHCHSQCPTSHGRRAAKWKCEDCGVKVSAKSKRCSSCSHKVQNVQMKKKRKFEVTTEELYDLVHVQKVPFTQLGNRFGVSDNAVRKRCRVMGVVVPKKLYRHKK